MQRRQVVQAVGLLVAGAAGCSEAPSPEPAPPTGTPNVTDDGDEVQSITPLTPLQVENDYAWRESSDGTVLLDVTVTNPAPTARTATLTVIARLDGEEIEQRRSLDLDSGEQTEFTASFDFDYDAWEDGSKSLDFRFDYQS